MGEVGQVTRALQWPMTESPLPHPPPGSPLYLYGAWDQITQPVEEVLLFKTPI